MDTCSERSFRSQKSSASYTGTVNSRLPLLAGHTTGTGDLSQSYYSDDEPQRRSLHRQRFQPPPVRPPLPPVPRDPTRGYMEMGSPRTSELDLMVHKKSSSGRHHNFDSNRARYDKKKLTSLMSHQTNGGAGLVYKSDSEFTDQSDAPLQTSAAIRQRYFSSHPNNQQQQHLPVGSVPTGTAISNHIQHPVQLGPPINPTNSLPLNSSHMTSSIIPNHHPLQSPQQQIVNPAAQQQQLLPGQGDTRLKNRGNNALVNPPQINNAANIHPNIAEHGDAWEKDTVITGASNKSSSLENLPEFPSRGDGRLNNNNNGYHNGNNIHPGAGIGGMNNLEESEYGIYMDVPSRKSCRTFLTPTLSILIISLALISPPLFALLPVVLWSEMSCGYDCIATLMNIFFKSLILMIGCWAVFFRSSRSTLPSIHLIRAFLILFTLFYLISHWVFYLFKIIGPKIIDYSFILQFATGTADCALFFYYLAVVCMEIIHFRTEYVIKVVRNTDGESRFYTVGRMSIQSCASWILQQYYKDFSVFNPASLMTHSSSKTRSNKYSNPQQYKFYDIDSFMPPTSGGTVANTTTALIDKSRAIIAASARKRDAGHNDRFYEEQDLDRRIKKRRARLIVAAEEAFSHLKRVDDDDNFQLGAKPPMNASESAKAIFPSMARALQKYLKITNQQYRYTQEAIYDHLARCLTLDFTPKAFLEKYLNPGPVITSEAEQKPIQNWDLISDCCINRGIKENVVFQLRQDCISLIVYVARVPHLYVREGSMDSNQGTFVLRLDSETSV